MKNISVILAVLMFMNINSYADLSGVLEIEEKKLVSKAEIERLGEPNCDNAFEISDKANELANIYSQMLEPFYSARRDDESAAINTLRKWGAIEMESEANKLKRLRNVAILVNAECLFNAGDYKAALSNNYKALDLIDSKNTKLWKRSYDLMQKIIDLE